MVQLLYSQPSLDSKNLLRLFLNISSSLAGCDDNDNCKCNLELVKASSFRAAPEELVVGERKTLSAELRVRNLGDEPAYNNELLIQAAWPVQPPVQLKNCVNTTVSGGNEVGVRHRKGATPFERAAPRPVLIG